MTEFTWMVLRQLGVAALAVGLLLILALLLHRPVLAWLRRRYGPEAKLPYGKLLAGILLLGYLLVLVKVTFTGRVPSYGHYANVHLFRAWRDAWNNFSQQDWLNVLLNVAMFAPLGVLLPLLSRRLSRLWALGLCGLGLSLAIELGQLVSGMGLFDVDDLFCNTLGALLGGMAMLALLSLLRGQHRLRRCILYLTGPLAFVGVLGAVFTLYLTQEYGNLPQAPSYRVPVEAVDWVGEAPLPEGPLEAPVYRAPGLTMEASDAFAQDLFAAQGHQAQRKWRGETEVLYTAQDGLQSLWVDRREGTWQYRTGEMRAEQQPECSREDLLEKLSPFGIQVPEQASLLRDEDGAYRFSLSACVTDRGLADGDVCVLLDESGAVAELNCLLAVYAPYGHTSLRSPEAAFAALQRGDFRGTDWFPGQEPERYAVTAWTLHYSLDTKGFYRPMYRFTATADGQEISGGLLVSP